MSTKRRRRRAAARPLSDVLKPIVTLGFFIIVALFVFLNLEGLHYAWQNQIQDVILLAAVVITLFVLILYIFKKK